MAFDKQRLACWVASLCTTLAASTAGAQVYTQPPAQQPYANPRYATQPAAYAGQPAGVARNATQPAAAPQQPYGNQPAAYAQPQAPQRQPAAAGASPDRFAVPGRYQAPGAVTYPEAGRPAAGGVRPVQYDQPIEQQPVGTAPQQPAGQQPLAQQPFNPPANPQQGPVSDSPGYVATEVSTGSLPNSLPADVVAAQAPQEHPLMPALRWAKQGMEGIKNVHDYSCTLVKRERIDGVLGEHEYIFVKVRHHPFSVYMYFLGPASKKGREAIYVDGQNNGNLLAHDNGIKHRLIGTVQLKPTAMLAMSGNRYPITEMGMRRLLERLLEVGGNDVKYGECTVNWVQGVKIGDGKNDRVCTLIQVEHPIPRRNFIFHKARIYVDDEIQLPIRYEAYDWPAPGTKEPQLVEEYTFLNVKLNNGFTDADFSTENAKYGFQR